MWIQNGYLWKVDEKSSVETYKGESRITRFFLSYPTKIEHIVSQPFAMIFNSNPM